MISMPILSRAKSYAWAIFSLRKRTTKTIKQVFSILKILYLRVFFCAASSNQTSRNQKYSTGESKNWYSDSFKFLIQILLGFWLFYSRIINSLVAIQHFNSSWPTPSQWKSTNMTWSWEETNCSPHLLSWQKHPWFLIFSPQSSPNLFVILQEPQKVGTIRSSSLVWKLPRILHTIYFPQIPSIFPSNLKCLQNFLG